MKVVFGAKPAPLRLTREPGGPLSGDRLSVTVVTLKGAETMKFVLPWETSTNFLDSVGTVSVVPAGIAPDEELVKECVPAHVADPLELKQ